MRKTSWTPEIVETKKGECEIIAFDEKTKEKITVIAYLDENANLIFYKDVFNTLKNKGYNPHQHNSQFDFEGRILFYKGK